ncbi:hypothetical protein ACFR9U_07745 [Halorientalis brevis]|uniref:DUF8081 domain-containing protein n=1 Tax=Halorientalis brevis TaxID=1126241 RepID=A0ABD6CCE0_9EURY
MEFVATLVTGSGYVVEIKPSARRSCPAVGTWVNTQGSVRRFETKPLARAWARTVSGPHATVWIQDAAPTDDRDVDGYLVGGDRRGRPRAGGDTAAQAELARY